MADSLVSLSLTKKELDTIFIALVFYRSKIDVNVSMQDALIKRLHLLVK